VLKGRRIFMANLNSSLTNKQGMGLIKIENGKVVVINPIDGNKPAKILPCDEKLFLLLKFLKRTILR